MTEQDKKGLASAWGEAYAEGRMGEQEYWTAMQSILLNGTTTVEQLGVTERGNPIMGQCRSGDGGYTYAIDTEAIGYARSTGNYEFASYVLLWQICYD